jgi:hypothetical protein
VSDQDAPPVASPERTVTPQILIFPVLSAFLLMLLFVRLYHLQVGNNSAENGHSDKQWNTYLVCSSSLDLPTERCRKTVVHDFRPGQKPDGRCRLRHLR